VGTIVSAVQAHLMKLLFGIKSLDVPGGGAERVLTIVASGLAERGHDVTVVTFDAPGGSSFYPLNLGVNRICLDIGSVSAATGLKPFLARMSALRRTVRDQRPDVVVGFMHSMFVPLAFSMVGTGTPLVASEHIVPEYYRDRRLQYALFKMACLMATRVTVLSEAVKLGYPRILQKRMIPMPNPVVVYEQCHVDVVAENKSPKIVLSVGRLERQKDHMTLVNAFAAVADQFPDWNVRIVGDGSLRADLEAAISRHGLEGRVALPGSTDRIDREYEQAQLLAVPSRFESFGMVTAEAMAVGLPVLGFVDCPGTNELISHGKNGWLVTPEDAGDRVKAYAAGLSTLLNDGGLRRRLGDGGHRHTRGFDSKSVIDNWQDLLAGAAGGVS
jgi:glycosyltransferase involved in cell wall biosynthesis